ncbi:MAG: hypothetical protein ACRD4R_06870 [Candidatus Acidiferrales bacterium]
MLSRSIGLTRVLRQTEHDAFLPADADPRLRRSLLFSLLLEEILDHDPAELPRRAALLARYTFQLAAIFLREPHADLFRELFFRNHIKQSNLGYH